MPAQMKRLPAGTPDWARVYGFVLARDPRWDRQLKDKSEAGLALRADASAIYPELRQLGKAASHLRSLAASVAPADKEAATYALDELRATLRDEPRHQLVLERSEALRELGALTSGVVYDETKPAPTFSGRATWLDADTVEIPYEFDAESELDCPASTTSDAVDLVHDVRASHVIHDASRLSSSSASLRDSSEGAVARHPW